MPRIKKPEWPKELPHRHFDSVDSNPDLLVRIYQDTADIRTVGQFIDYLDREDNNIPYPVAMRAKQAIETYFDTDAVAEARAGGGNLGFRKLSRTSRLNNKMVLVFQAEARKEARTITLKERRESSRAGVPQPEKLLPDIFTLVALRQPEPRAAPFASDGSGTSITKALPVDRVQKKCH